MTMTLDEHRAAFWQEVDKLLRTVDEIMQAIDDADPDTIDRLVYEGGKLGVSLHAHAKVIVSDRTTLLPTAKVITAVSSSLTSAREVFDLALEYAKAIRQADDHRVSIQAMEILLRGKPIIEA